MTQRLAKIGRPAIIQRFATMSESDSPAIQMSRLMRRDPLAFSYVQGYLDQRVEIDEQWESKYPLLNMYQNDEVHDRAEEIWREMDNDVDPEWEDLLDVFFISSEFPADHDGARSRLTREIVDHTDDENWLSDEFLMVPVLQITKHLGWLIGPKNYITWFYSR